MIERGYLFDYGAQRSIREEACGRATPALLLGARRDDVHAPSPADADPDIEMFLKDHNVDLGQFNEQVKVIFDNSIKVGDISNSTGVTIGDNSSSKVNDSPKGAK